MSGDRQADALAVCSAERTAQLLPFPTLVLEIARVARGLHAGTVQSPTRHVLALPQDGRLLSMPAVAPDVAIHKLVTVQPDNRTRGLPTIHGIVTVCDAPTGAPRLLLDGPELTGRRTAAVSLLALHKLLPDPPRSVLLIGTGIQARHHVRALAAIYPACAVHVHGTSQASTARFVADASMDHPSLHMAPSTADDGRHDAVIAATTAQQPVWTEAPRAGRVVVGVGAFRPDMAEIGPRALKGADVWADDPDGARHEAGDLIQAGVDFRRVRSLGELVDATVDFERPAVFKSVGSAAWDLAAARVALGR